MKQEPVSSRSDVMHRLANVRGEIRELGVQQLGLFGSFSQDTADESSDVDFVVVFEQGSKSFDALFELTTLLEQTLGRTVELITPESLDSEVWSALEQEVEYVEVK
jgi:hypothetical protein